MPPFDPGEGYRVPDEVIEVQEEHAERVAQMQADPDTDNLREEFSGVGRERWLVILLAIAGIAGLLLLAYWIFWLMAA